MSKHKNLAVTEAAGLAGRALAALNAQGEKIAKEINGGDSLRLVKAGPKFSALITHGVTAIQIESDGESTSYAVSTHD